ncbi:DUF7289 family protein [Methanoculleus horonobensis]|uniref:DUF7289 family protein n=1 Tax=Methanoculleus horonobensis TaxID=528314 RepID=UPI001F254BD1|nr:hypothetical protein [Methanoculleus horonobensis]
MNDKAVSEAVGFVLILGIVISGIGLVTLYGYPVLVKEQSNTDVKNMERAMIVIQNDMKSLCFKNVPYKETSLQVSGGTFEVINASQYGCFINVTNGTTLFQKNYTVGALTYRSDRGTAVTTLENGAVMIRQDGATGSAMLAEPRWFYDNSTDTLVIYIMNITTDTLMAKSGMTTVRMGLEGSETQSIPVAPGDNVTVEYTSSPSGDYSTAWENYLTGASVGMQRSALNSYYERNDVKTLVIKEYRIKIHDI